MAHFARIENNLVTEVLVVHNDLEDRGADFLYTYDDVNDVFISPQPFASWSLDENFDWQPPTPMPTEGRWYWNEDSLSWLEQSL
jgi:hypothetical protein